MTKSPKKTKPSPPSHDPLAQLEQFKAFLHFHGYQPPRRLVIEDETLYDITGEHELVGGYNERVWKHCYHPMMTRVKQEGLDDGLPILQSQLVSKHLFGITRDWIRMHHPRSWKFVREVMSDAAIPFVDPYLHQILPLLPDQAQGLIVEIGIRAWEQDMDKKLVDENWQPLTGFGFWPPELGITHKTAEILRHKGVQFLALDQAQIQADEFAPVYEISTKYGRIWVIAYNGKEFAQKLAFSEIKDAQAFADKVHEYINYTGKPPFAAMDMETFGEWRGQDSIYFLNFLVNRGLNPEMFFRSRDMIRPGKIIDASSWSCDCSLGRWSGEHVCCGESSELQQLKKDLYHGLRIKLEQILYDLNHLHHDWHPSFVNFFINTRSQLGGGETVSFSGLSREFQTPFRRLYVALVGLTSCGWFYTDSELERNIPKNCLEYLSKEGG